MRSGRTRNALAALLVAAALVLGVGALSASSAPAADFSVTLDRTSVGLVAGGQATATVHVNKIGSWAASVALQVTGQPVGMNARVLPSTVKPTGVAVLGIVAAPSLAPGSYPLTVIGSAGSTVHAVGITVVVTRATQFALTVTPPSATVVDGGATTYAIGITRMLYLGPITFTVSGLPTGATGSVTPRIALGRTAALAVTVGVNVVPGTYQVTVRGTGALYSTTATAYLVVVPQTFPNFPIAGTLDRLLAPGVTGQLNLALTNPVGSPMTVTALGVTLAGTNQAGCPSSNFAVTPYSGPAQLVVPAHSTRTLQQLGVAAAAWPKVTMLDLAANQDACKNATVTLAYSGNGSGS